jgi:hypothetical protein
MQMPREIHEILASLGLHLRKKEFLNLVYFKQFLRRK